LGVSFVGGGGGVRELAGLAQVETLSRLTGYRGEEARFGYLAVGREGAGCYTRHFRRAEGVPGERAAREIAELIVGELRRATGETARYGVRRSERACSGKTLAYLQTARERSKPRGELNHRGEPSSRS
jgi:hypothetical protein